MVCLFRLSDRSACTLTRNSEVKIIRFYSSSDVFDDLDLCMDNLIPAPAPASKERVFNVYINSYNSYKDHLISLDDFKKSLMDIISIDSGTSSDLVLNLFIS